MKSKGFHPTEIIFSTTTACNLHCEHCFINRTPHKLEISDAVRLIESCVESSSIDRIGFSGGEPFLYMDFLIEVTKAAIDHDLMFDQIMTNGDWWRDESDLVEKLQTLYDAGYDGKIGLSWDSYHGQTTERMETFIRTVQEIFGEDSINIQTVEDDTVVEALETTVERRHAELVSASTRRSRNKFGMTSLIDFYSFNVCTKLLQLSHKVFVTSFNLIYVTDSAFAVSTHCGNYHSHTCADIR